jgi:hypothetical protein
MATTIPEPPKINLDRLPSQGSGNGGFRNLVPAEGDLRRVKPSSPPPASTGIWVGLAAITMTFAAFTSALIVRQGSARDWHSGLGIEIVGSGDEVEIAPGEEQRGDERRGGEGGGGQGGRAEVSARWRWAPRQGQAPPVGEGAQPSAEVGDPLPDGERGRGEGSDR